MEDGRLKRPKETISEERKVKMTANFNFADLSY